MSTTPENMLNAIQDTVETALETAHDVVENALETAKEGVTSLMSTISDTMDTDTMHAESDDDMDETATEETA